MKQLDKIIDGLLQPINPSAIIILGIYTIIWGLWVASPFWSVFGGSQIFSILGAFPPQGPEVFWGCVAILCGGITTYGAIKHKYRPLVRGAAVAGWHWTMIAIFYFIGNWTSTGGLTALAFASYAAFVWLNLRINKKHMNDDGDLFVH